LFQKYEKDLKGLLLEPDLDALLAQFSRMSVELEDAEAYRSSSWTSGLQGVRTP
jgi:hypothetical protein